MITYKTYQEAKIANPESEICKFGGEFTTSSTSDFGHVLQPCHPANHCMTVEQFLKDGHKFVEGDWVISPHGDAVHIGRNPPHKAICYGVGTANELEDLDCDRFVLRAEALEKPQPRTKVEYVSCEFTHAWEAVKFVESEDGEELYRSYGMADGELGFNRILHLMGVIVNFDSHNLYRRIESPITWQDEVKSYLDDCDRIDGSCILKDFSYKATSEHDHFDAENNEFDLEFVGLCHLVASMTDKPGV